MERIGLMPSFNSQVGGRRTGDSMADCVIQSGRLLAACADLLTKDFRISWYDWFTNTKTCAGVRRQHGDATPSRCGWRKHPGASQCHCRHMVRFAYVDAAGLVSGGNGPAGDLRDVPWGIDRDGLS